MHVEHLLHHFMTNNIPSHLVWSELFGAELKRERGGGRDLYLNVKLF